jgi:hypothetical protein
MMPKITGVVAAAVLLAGCQQAPVRDEASHDSRVSVGSSFVLHESLSVPAGHARVFLQGGKVVAKKKLDLYRPHCDFEVRSVSDGSLRIAPDSFLVTKVIVYEEEVVSRPQPLRYAAYPMVRVSGGDGSFSLITRFVRHNLSSEKQPEVMRLTCHGGLDMPFYARTPGIAEIRQALGKYVTLELASTGN